MTSSEARSRLAALGLEPPAVDALVAHFEDAERRGKVGHGLSRVDWLESLEFDPAARPLLLESQEGFERWDGHGSLGYLVLEEIVRATLADPPERARVVVVRRCFPTGVLGYWVRRLAEGGLVAVLTATSPRRLAHPDGGEPLTGTNPLAIAIPSSDGAPIVTDVSMGAVTHGAVLTGAAHPKSSCRSGVSGRTRHSLSLWGSSFSFPPWRDRSMAPSSWSLARTTTRCLRSASSRQVAGCPATVSSSAG